MQPVHSRDSLMVSVVDQHPQRLELTVKGKDTQALGTNRGDGNRMVQGRSC